MKWLPDKTQRFAQYPHYEKAEIDSECERIVSEFLRQKYGNVDFPISTDDLTVLIESRVASLDPYADLSSLGSDVEGVTNFFPGEQPRVRIASCLSEETARENRLRTTITHELGHVHFHNCLYQYQFDASPSFLDKSNQGKPLQCKRDKVHGLNKGTDWMEWQAGYASGAFLMPKTCVARIAQERLASVSLVSPISTNAPEAATLIAAIIRNFQVSQDAARVRLIYLGYLVEGTPPLRLL